MKKWICFAAALALLLALAGCVQNEPMPTESGEPTSAPTEPATELPTTAPTEATTEAPETVVCAVSGQGGTLFRNDSGEVWLSAWVTVRNDGASPVRLAPMDLTASVNGSELKTLAAVSAYPNVIAPGETACYYDEARVDTDSTGTAELHFTLAPEAAAQDAVVRYEVSNTSLRDSVYGGLTLTGEVKNTSSADSSGMVCVAAVLSDDGGAVIGVLYAYLSDPLPAGESVGFTLDSFMLPDDITAASVADLQTFAYPA